jgi:hypothetical protein
MPTSSAESFKGTIFFVRTLSGSVSAFPGVVVEMTRLDQGGWRNHVKLMNTR